MTQNFVSKNEVTLSGIICEPFKFSHITHGGNRIFETYMEVKRTSGVSDFIPLLVNGNLIANGKQESEYVGAFVCVTGTFRSYNMKNGTRKLVLSVYVDDIYVRDESEWKNDIVIHGFLCTKPTYRRTPAGREITDLVLAVNRPYGKSDYIPCICWEENANNVSGYSVGDFLQTSGRIQSRNYIKKMPDGITEERTAYEVSIFHVKNESVDTLLVNK